MRTLVFLFACLITLAGYSQPDIKAGEYFIGTFDPGAGNATSFTVQDGAWDEVMEVIVANAQILTSASSPTLINIRLKDNNNNWGPTYKKALFFNSSSFILFYF